MTDHLSFKKILAYFGTFMKITQTRLCSRNKSCFLIGLEVGIPGNSLNFTGLGSFLPANGLTPLNLPANGLTPKIYRLTDWGPPHGPPQTWGCLKKRNSLKSVFFGYHKINIHHTIFI